MTGCLSKTTSDRSKIGGETAFSWVAILELISLMDNYNSAIRATRFYLNRLTGSFTGLNPAEEVLTIKERLPPLSLLSTLSTTPS